MNSRATHKYKMRAVGSRPSARPKHWQPVNGSQFIAAERQRGSTLFLTRFGSSRVHSTESFARSMYCRDLDLVSVCMFVVIPGA